MDTLCDSECTKVHWQKAAAAVTAVHFVEIDSKVQKKSIHKKPKDDGLSVIICYLRLVAVAA